MKAAFGKVWRLEDIGGSIIGGVFKLIGENRKNPPAPWDADLPKPKGQTVASYRNGLQTLPKAIEKILGPERVKAREKTRAHGGGKRRRCCFLCSASVCSSPRVAQCHRLASRNIGARGLIRYMFTPLSRRRCRGSSLT